MITNSLNIIDPNNTGPFEPGDTQIDSNGNISVYTTDTSIGTGTLLIDGSATSTISSSNLLYGNGTGTWATINPYIYGSDTPTDYTINGHVLKMNRGLENAEISFISLIELNGYKYYDTCIKNGYHIVDDLKEKLEPIINQIKRSKKIKSILNKNNQTGC
jgi:hypothetical protein